MWTHQAETPTTSQDRVSGRLIGLLYLTLAIFGAGAFFTFTEQIHVPGDAVVTIRNIMDRPMTFRLTLVAWLITLVVDLVVGFLLFRALRPVAPHLSLATAWFRTAYVAVHTAALFGLFGVLRLMNNGDLSAQPELAMALIGIHLDGFMIALVLFGAHLVILGWIIMISGAVPRLIGGLLTLAGLAYILDTVALALLPETALVSQWIDIGVMVFATLGELSFVVWLLAFGIRQPHQRGGTFNG